MVDARYRSSGVCVDDDVDETARVLELEKLASESDFDVRMYTILTTTACNAACPYCYESQWEDQSMDDATAESVAEYILNDSKRGDEIHLWWFGGEPLLNMQPIRTITRALEDDGERSIHAKITTNGSLITASVAAELLQLRVSSVQVTVDGLQVEHDKSKCFACVPPNSREIDSVSPFEGLMHSVDLLIAHGIGVQVRVNTGKDYRDCIPSVLSYFETRFPARQPSLYFEPIDSLFKNDSSVIPEEELSDFYAYAIDAWATWNRCKQPDDLLYPYLTTHCGACVSYLSRINPDGSLGKCHRDPDYACGSVFRSQQETRIEQYYDFDHPSECLECIFLPCCHGGCQYKARYADFDSAKCCKLKYDIDSRLECAFNLFLAGLDNRKP